MTHQGLSHDIKAVTEPSGAYDELYRTFEAFKETNDQRLGDIETRLSSDVLIEEKLERIDQAITETKARLERAALDARRPHLSDGSKRDPLLAEHKAAFDAYVRSGEAGGLKRLEAKALTGTSGPDGGFLAPSVIEQELLARMASISPIRSVASVQVVSSGAYKRAYAPSGFASGWVGETAARPETTTPALVEMNFPAMELYAMPAATQTLLDDAIVNIEQWLAGEVETVFAEQESQAFVNGDGVNKPRGFMNYPTVANTSWSWGNIGFVNTGVSAAFPTANPSDTLVELIYNLRGVYRQNASFVMSRRTQSIIRRFKDANGNYLWQPPAGPGQPASLMGFPVIESEHMPEIAANSLAVAFGDFKRGYLIVDRAGVRVLRDPFSSKPYVLFYTTKRVGGGVQDFDAIKVLRFGT